MNQSDWLHRASFPLLVWIMTLSQAIFPIVCLIMASGEASILR